MSGPVSQHIFLTSSGLKTHLQVISYKVKADQRIVGPEEEVQTDERMSGVMTERKKGSL